ncbi:MAG TPA: DUF3243 domain-containing protein [Firmicutes bacterium]|nr:DUF3243 domain-containing protein [Bacillota bacterium]
MDLGELNIKFFENWDHFLSTLAKGVKTARAIGVSENHIEDVATMIGDFLYKHVDPENIEQRTIKERWEHADETRRHAIAREVLAKVDQKIKEEEK